MRTIVPLKDFHENADIELLEWKKWRDRAEKAEAEVEKLTELLSEVIHRRGNWIHEDLENRIEKELIPKWKAKAEASEG